MNEWKNNSLLTRPRALELHLRYADVVLSDALVAESSQLYPADDSSWGTLLRDPRAPVPFVAEPVFAAVHRYAVGTQVILQRGVTLVT